MLTLLSFIKHISVSVSVPYPVLCTQENVAEPEHLG